MSKHRENCDHCKQTEINKQRLLLEDNKVEDSSDDEAISVEYRSDNEDFKEAQNERKKYAWKDHLNKSAVLHTETEEKQQESFSLVLAGKNAKGEDVFEVATPNDDRPNMNDVIKPIVGKQMRCDTPRPSDDLRLLVITISNFFCSHQQKRIYDNSEWQLFDEQKTLTQENFDVFKNAEFLSENITDARNRMLNKFPLDVLTYSGVGFEATLSHARYRTKDPKDGTEMTTHTTWRDLLQNTANLKRPAYVYERWDEKEQYPHIEINLYWDLDYKIPYNENAKILPHRCERLLQAADLLVEQEKTEEEIKHVLWKTYELYYDNLTKLSKCENREAIRKSLQKEEIRMTMPSYKYKKGDQPLIRNTQFLISRQISYNKFQNLKNDFKNTEKSQTSLISQKPTTKVEKEIETKISKSSTLQPPANSPKIVFEKVISKNQKRKAKKRKAEEEKKSTSQSQEGKIPTSHSLEDAVKILQNKPQQSNFVSKNRFEVLQENKEEKPTLKPNENFQLEHKRVTELKKESRQLYQPAKNPLVLRKDGYCRDHKQSAEYCLCENWEITRIPLDTKIENSDPIKYPKFIRANGYCKHHKAGADQCHCSTWEVVKQPRTHEQCWCSGAKQRVPNHKPSLFQPRCYYHLVRTNYCKCDPTKMFQMSGVWAYKFHGKHHLIKDSKICEKHRRMNHECGCIKTYRYCPGHKVMNLACGHSNDEIDEAVEKKTSIWKLRPTESKRFKPMSGNDCIAIHASWDARTKCSDFRHTVEGGAKYFPLTKSQSFEKLQAISFGKFSKTKPECQYFHSNNEAYLKCSDPSHTIKGGALPRKEMIQRSRSREQQLRERPRSSDGWVQCMSMHTSTEKQLNCTDPMHRKGELKFNNRKSRSLQSLVENEGYNTDGYRRYYEYPKPSNFKFNKNDPRREHLLSVCKYFHTNKLRKQECEDEFHRLPHQQNIFCKSESLEEICRKSKLTNKRQHTARSSSTDTTESTKRYKRDSSSDSTKSTNRFSNWKPKWYHRRNRSSSPINNNWRQRRMEDEDLAKEVRRQNFMRRKYQRLNKDKEYKNY